MIQIANWLLTRRCNLNCSYCAIARDYDVMPIDYPELSHYAKNEMDTDTVIDNLKRLKAHNPNMFHIFYGGEPLLRTDLPEIIKFCNENSIHYTIITNNSQSVQPALQSLISKVGKLKGLTSSVDPIIMRDSFPDKDRLKKSKDGFERLKGWKKIVNDVVAEITVDSEMLDDLIPLVSMLTDNGISSSITFVDISKNEYYDFSNVRDESILVQKNDKVKKILDELTNPKYDVHMAKELLPKIYDILPSNLDCGIEKNLHNITIDADGTLRLCLRIRGMKTPEYYLDEYIMQDGRILNSLMNHIKEDKKEFCIGCNWTCMLMTELIESKESDTSNLIHSDRR
jgi:MoaA/NifB/PqqE/SkfB family radical SAM enzyme